MGLRGVFSLINNKMEKVIAKLRGGAVNCRDLLVGDCPLYVIQMYTDKKACCREIFTRIGPWDKLSILMREHSVERKTRNGGYTKLIHHSNEWFGYESKILEVKKSANDEPYYFYIDIFPAYCI